MGALELIRCIGQFDAKRNTMIKELVDFEARIIDVANHFLRQHGGGFWKRRFLRRQKKQDRARRRAMYASSMKIADKTKLGEEEKVQKEIHKVDNILAGTKQMRTPIRRPIHVVRTPSPPFTGVTRAVSGSLAGLAIHPEQ